MSFKNEKNNNASNGPRRNLPEQDREEIQRDKNTSRRTRDRESASKRVSDPERNTDSVPYQHRSAHAPQRGENDRGKDAMVNREENAELRPFENLNQH